MIVLEFGMASCAVVGFAPIAGRLVRWLVGRSGQCAPFVIAQSGRKSCGRPQAAYAAFPFVRKFACERGRIGCAPIAPYFAIELAAIAIAMWATAVEADSITLWADCLLGWTLVALAWIDVLHRRLPDRLTLPLLALGLLLEAATASELAAHILGAMVGYAVFRVIAGGYRAVRQRDGLGGGDAKLLAAAGAWVGWTGLPDIIMIAALLGIAGTIALHARGIAASSVTALPFGPYLAFALWIVRLYGPLIFVV